jgi:cell division septum initiation protein DivIVA
MGLFNDFDRAEAELLRKENKELKERIRILEERINKKQDSGMHFSDDSGPSDNSDYDDGMHFRQY